MNLANIKADIIKQVAMRCSDPFMKDHIKVIGISAQGETLMQ